MDPVLAFNVMVVAASLLALVVSMLLLYMVIRLAVGHSLRAHYYWQREQ